jgi:ATPase family AAA domain-containing protein 2
VDPFDTCLAMDTLRVYRPRVVIHGPAGMGQAFVGSAMLHHLEGHHIQSLELGTLLSDSTTVCCFQYNRCTNLILILFQTIEAGIVQLFVEAKRHQPSVIYIPSLSTWSQAVSETARTTVKAMLDTLQPTDPILLLAVVDGSFRSLPRDIRQWFGLTRENRIELVAPSEKQREDFFEPLLEDVRKPPNEFVDGMPRKKRVLEVLPVAPPLPPREPTKEELAKLEQADDQLIMRLKGILFQILAEIKRKFKRFAKPARVSLLNVTSSTLC